MPTQLLVGPNAPSGKKTMVFPVCSLMGQYAIRVAVTTQRLRSRTLVGGEWTDGSGGTQEIANPATGETIAEVPRCTAEDVDPAVEAARRALPDWLDATPKDRSELLLLLADTMEEDAAELARSSP